MKIVVTGSLGHISRPLTEDLVNKGHRVTVISRKSERRTEIEAMGATAAIGTMHDAEFLATTFAQADAVYVMEATSPESFADSNIDITAVMDQIVGNYKQAILKAGVKRVVHLSSIGAHTNQGNGILKFHYQAEKILDTLPSDVSLSFIRPVGFYGNLLGFIPTIKAQGVIASNYAGDEKKPWVSPLDIATVVAEELTGDSHDRRVRYVASEEISCNEIAAILGAAIGQPHLSWILISDEQLLQGMVAFGMNPTIAAGFVEMNAAIRSGLLYEDYGRHRPVLGKIKVRDFASEFAAAYNQV